MHLIGLTGKARSGKDTVANYLSQQHRFHRYAMAGPLKAMLEVGLGLREQDFQTTEQKEAVIPWLGKSYRWCAQTLGTEWMRQQINQDGWLILAERVFEQLEWEGAVGVAVSDIRFENEAAMIRRLGGTVVHVYRRDFGEHVVPEATKGHASEAGLAVAPGDYVLTNDGTIESLYQQVDSIYAVLVRK